MNIIGKAALSTGIVFALAAAVWWAETFRPGGLSGLIQSSPPADGPVAEGSDAARQAPLPGAGQNAPMARSESRDGHESLALELEALLLTTADLLALGGSIERAQALLQTALLRALTMQTEPRWTPVIEAIRQDLERLDPRSSPRLSAQAALAESIRLLDGLRFLRLEPASVISQQAEARSGTTWSWSWASIWQQIQRQASEIVSIRRVDHAGPVLSRTEDQTLVLDRLLLRLLSARMAVMLADRAAALEELAQAQTILESGFDLSQPQVAALNHQVQTAQKMLEQVEDHHLEGSIAALRRLRLR